MNKKGQLSLSDAPNIVLIVGLTFLAMATIAFLGMKYGGALPAEKTTTVTNETLTTVNELGEYVTNRSVCNFERFAVTAVNNATSGTRIPSSNYTVGTDGKVSYKSGANPNVYGFNNSNWLVTYTYYYTGAGCEVNRDLQTEIGNNTSIAGIILTISLIGVVLSILIGIFYVAKNRGM